LIACHYKDIVTFDVKDVTRMKRESAFDESEQLAEINAKLQVIVALLLRSLSKDTQLLPLRDQIAILDELGVRPATIARILGKKTGYVSKELVGIRRSGRK
jgi:hypothetical protein